MGTESMPSVNWRIFVVSIFLSFHMAAIAQEACLDEDCCIDCCIEAGFGDVCQSSCSGVDPDCSAFQNDELIECEAAIAFNSDMVFISSDEELCCFIESSTTGILLEEETFDIVNGSCVPSDDLNLDDDFNIGLAVAVAVVVTMFVTIIAACFVFRQAFEGEATAVSQAEQLNREIEAENKIHRPAPAEPEADADEVE